MSSEYYVLAPFSLLIVAWVRGMYCAINDEPFFGAKKTKEKTQSCCFASHAEHLMDYGSVVNMEDFSAGKVLSFWPHYVGNSESTWIPSMKITARCSHCKAVLEDTEPLNSRERSIVSRLMLDIGKLKEDLHKAEARAKYAADPSPALVGEKAQQPIKEPGLVKPRKGAKK